jgi:hypothetical protein
LLECQQGRVFEGEEGEASEERVGESNGIGGRIGVGELLELIVEELDECIAREVFAREELRRCHIDTMNLCTCKHMAR